MDKTKIGAILALLAIGGLMLAARIQQDPVPNSAPVAHDHNNDGTSDHGDDAHSNEPKSDAPKSDGADLSGGVTALKIEDIRKGDGATAKAGDSVTVNYRGTLLSGKLFDESYGKAPFEFQLGAGNVIKGWDQGVAGMKVGGKRKLTIPAELGYGDAGAGADIPPGATLLFDVELLKVNGKG